MIKISRLYTSITALHNFNLFSSKSMSFKQTGSTHFSTSIDIINLDLSFGDKTIFNNLGLHLNAREKLFLVGENGIGKSTLLKIIHGNAYDYTGKRHVKGIIGYLPQSFDHFAERTIVEHLITESNIPDLMDLLKEKLTSNFDMWKNEFYAYGGYQFMSLLNKLKLDDINLNRRFSSLSGGEKVKIHLAALSLLKPDILLLDEPTNHLDENGLHWLESFLKSYTGALITTTHDRQLINNTATRIAELSPSTHTLVHFSGNYKSYLQQQEKIRDRLDQERKNQINELKQLSGKLSQTIQKNPIYNHRSPSDRDKLSFNAHGERRQKSQKRITNQLSNKITILEKNIIEIPQKPTQLNVGFLSNALFSDSAIEVKNSSKQFNEQVLFSSVNFTLKKDERVILTGANGSGKSTFLKMLSGRLTLNTGTVTIAPDVRIGYLDQEQETLDLSKSPFEIIYEHSGITISREKALHHLHNFGIQFAHDLYSPIQELSVGCKRKVQLAQITLQGANVLLLDEPTNHIDFVSLEKIEEELMKFPGSIFAISHDRYFINRIATKVIHMHDFNPDYGPRNNQRF